MLTVVPQTQRCENDGCHSYRHQENPGWPSRLREVKPSLDLLEEASKYFTLTLGQARAIIKEVATITAALMQEAVFSGWACLRTIGPFPFDTAGIVKPLIDPLSRNDIGVFVICTFDGEHVSIPPHKLDVAKKHLKAAGHSVLPALNEWRFVRSPVIWLLKMPRVE
nr:ACT domain-containing protein [uncultured Cohaesibacter sp.]